MKKILAVLMALCMLCTAVCALADEAEDDAADYAELPQVMEAESEDDFYGEWALDAVLIGDTVVDAETAIAEIFGGEEPLVGIHDGFLYDYTLDEDGEIIEDKTKEYEYTFTDGRLEGEGEGQKFIIELLEDANIVMTIVTDDGEISMFMVEDDSEG